MCVCHFAILFIYFGWNIVAVVRGALNYLHTLDENSWNNKTRLCILTNKLTTILKMLRKALEKPFCPMN